MAKLTLLQREQIRQERRLRDIAALKVLREHFTGYEARDGYDIRHVENIPASRRRALRKKYTKVATLLSQPYDVIKPKDKKEAKALRHFTQEKFRRMKHFIVHKPDEASRVTMEGGAVTVKRAFTHGVEFEQKYFFFPRRARGPGHMRRMLEEMLPDMPEGMYAMQTAAYGDTGSIVDRGQLMNQLRDYLGAYDKAKYGEYRFMNQITGFRYMATTLKGAQVQQRARDSRRRGQREANEQRREELRQLAAARARALRCPVKGCVLPRGHKGPHMARRESGK